MVETRFFEAPDGTRLAWDEAGSGSPVLLLHGIGSSRRRWDPQFEALSAAGFRVIRLDQRAFGESEGADQRYGMDRFVADVSAFVEHLRLETLHVVGHSLGAMVAQRYAVDHTACLRSLVLASTTSHNGRRATAFAHIMMLLGERGFDAVLADPALRPEAEQALRDAFPGAPVPIEMLKVGVEKPNPARANAWRACMEFSTKDRLGELRCPVLVMHGSADPLIPFRAGQLVHEAIAHSEWIAFDGAGHSVPRERADEFNRAVLVFLRRAEAQPRVALAE